MNISITNKLEEFRRNLSFEDIYTLDEDDETRLEYDRVCEGISTLRNRTGGFRAITRDVLSSAIQASPSCITALRYLTGLHSVTLELLASVRLYHSGVLTGPVRKKTERTLESLVQKNPRAATELGQFFIERGARKYLKTLEGMNESKIRDLVELLIMYQLKGRLAKLRGHVAEKIIASYLDRWRVDFEPREKLTTLGYPDVKISCIADRMVNLAIPNKDRPEILIQCCYYTSITGSVASKTVREMQATRHQIDRFNKTSQAPTRFLGFIDGPGWIGMDAQLRGMLSIVDDFFQLRTIETKLKRETQKFVA